MLKLSIVIDSVILYIFLSNINSYLLFFNRISIYLFFFTIDFQPCLYKVLLAIARKHHNLAMANKFICCSLEA